MCNSEDLIESGQEFPTWFIEGFATTVENGYQFRYDDYIKMAPGQADMETEPEDVAETQDITEPEDAIEPLD